MFVEFYLSKLIFTYLLITINVISTTGISNILQSNGTSTAELIGNDIFFEITDPLELEYTYRLRPAKDFGAPFDTYFYLKNIPLVPVYPRYGCEIYENSDDVEGNVALVERGECSFKKKTIIAEMSGARAVIITEMSHTNDCSIEMVDDDTDEETNIPAGFLMGKSGRMIIKTLEKLKRSYAIINIPVNLTFTPIHKMNQPPWIKW